MKIAVLDVGGTAIKSGLWAEEVLTEQKEWDTDAAKGGRALVEKMKEILHNYSGFEAIGISTAGQVNMTDGSIYHANENIPGYTGVPVKALLEAEFQVPVAVENDVNAAALGELHYGAAKGKTDFLCLTYGTGVGGAIVTNGEVVHGSTWSGGGFGGIVVHPEDMTPHMEFSGCYEKYASATALVSMAKTVDASLDNGRKIFAAMERPEIREVIDAWIDEMVYGLVTLVHVFNPSDIILGGGILAQDYILEEVGRRLKEKVTPGFDKVCIERALLGNHAGLMGAVWLAQEALNRMQ